MNFRHMGAFRNRPNTHVNIGFYQSDPPRANPHLSPLPIIAQVLYSDTLGPESCLGAECGVDVSQT